MKYLERVRKIVGRLVDEGVAQSSADYDTDDAVKDDVLKVTKGKVRFSLSNAPPA